MQEQWGPLQQGIPIVLIPDVVMKELPRFVQTLAIHYVSRLILVPSLLRALLDTYSDLPFWVRFFRQPHRKGLLSRGQ